jgi:membrane protein
LWDVNLQQGDHPYKFLLYQLRTTLIVLRSVYRGDLTNWAASLTYVTLLAIVPFLAVIFSIFKAVGGLEGLQKKVEPFILQNLAIGSQDMVRDQIHSFVININAGAIGAVGGVVLFVTVITTMMKIERSLNEIWGIDKSRPFFQQLSVYLTLLVIGPILLGLSLSLTTAIQANSFLIFIQNEIPQAAGLIKLFFRLLPVFFTVIVFTTMYAIMPNTRVSIKSALIGGIMGGSVWELAKIGYTIYQAKSTNYSAIYGSLAAIPFFLLWIYISWVIVLFGAQIAHANENTHFYEWDGSGQRKLTYRIKQFIGVWLMIHICRNFDEGHPPLTMEVLNKISPVSMNWVNQVLGELNDGGLIVEATDRKTLTGFSPERPLQKIRLADIYNALAEQSSGEMTFSRDEESKISFQLLSDYKAVIMESELNLTMDELLGRLPEDQTAD